MCYPVTFGRLNPFCVPETMGGSGVFHKWRFPYTWGYQKKWFIVEDPIKIWIIWGWYPILGKLHMLNSPRIHPGVSLASLSGRSLDPGVRCSRCAGLLDDFQKALG